MRPVLICVVAYSFSAGGVKAFSSFLEAPVAVIDDVNAKRVLVVAVIDKLLEILNRSCTLYRGEPMTACWWTIDRDSTQTHGEERQIMEYGCNSYGS